MKKSLNTSSVMNELRGQSVFFPSKTEQVSKPEQAITPQQDSPLSHSQTSQDTDTSNQASSHASNHASKLASVLAQDEGLESIRKTLKLVGKEVLYVRLTSEEKKRIAEIEYIYQQKNIKTSGNEIGRIGINYLLADYSQNGEQSILAKLLAALHT